MSFVDGKMLKMEIKMVSHSVGSGDEYHIAVTTTVAAAIAALRIVVVVLHECYREQFHYLCHGKQF